MSVAVRAGDGDEGSLVLRYVVGLVLGFRDVGGSLLLQVGSHRVTLC